MEYHLFKKNVNKKVHWYYYYEDPETKKRVKRACKAPEGGPCLKKRDAEAYLEKVRQEYEEKLKYQNSLTFADISTAMYQDNSLYLKWLEVKGRKLSKWSLKIERRIALKIINPEFGDRYPQDIHPTEVENWLIEKDMSNNYKNLIIHIFNSIMKECQRQCIVKNPIKIERFKSEPKRKDIFTLQELKMFFPDDKDALEEAWSTNSYNDSYIGIDHKEHSYAFMFGFIFKLMLTTGMRGGEARAIQKCQIMNNCILLDRSFNGGKELQYFLKLGSEANPKTRIALLPESTKNLLDYWLKIMPADNTTDFIFTYYGKTLDIQMIHHKLKSLLSKYNIKDTRKLTPHSLRYCYNTYMVNAHFPQEILRELVGHQNSVMTDYYTRFNLESKLQSIAQYQQQINTIWDESQ